MDKCNAYTLDPSFNFNCQDFFTNAIISYQLLGGIIMCYCCCCIKDALHLSRLFLTWLLQSSFCVQDKQICGMLSRMAAAAAAAAVVKSV
jgi:hypothetical protein